MTEPGEAVDAVKFVIRVPVKMHAKIKKDAAKNNVSMNQFILKCIDERYMFAHGLEAKVDKILEVVESWTE